MNAARHVQVRLVQKDEKIKIPPSFLDIEEVIGILLAYQEQTTPPAIVQAFIKTKL